jgi:hypothetical protein
MCSALADVRFGSFASGSGRPPLQPCPLCPESDSRPPKMRSVAMGQTETNCTATKEALFDHLVGADQKR